MGVCGAGGGGGAGGGFTLAVCAKFAGQAPEPPPFGSTLTGWAFSKKITDGFKKINWYYETPVVRRVRMAPAPGSPSGFAVHVHLSAVTDSQCHTMAHTCVVSLG